MGRRGRLEVAESGVRGALMVAESGVRGAMAPAAADGAVDCLGTAWRCAPHAARHTLRVHARTQPAHSPLEKSSTSPRAACKTPGAVLDGQGHKGPSLDCYWFTSIWSSLFTSWQPRPAACG